MAIAQTAGRNVAFKVAKMRDSIMEDQDELIIRKSEREELGLETNAKAVLEDVGHNANLYIASQEDNTALAFVSKPSSSRSDLRIISSS
jgi:hypothetical protein